MGRLATVGLPFLLPSRSRLRQAAPGWHGTTSRHDSRCFCPALWRRASSRTLSPLPQRAARVLSAHGHARARSRLLGRRLCHSHRDQRLLPLILNAAPWILPCWQRIVSKIGWPQGRNSTSLSDWWWAKKAMVSRSPWQWHLSDVGHPGRVATCHRGPKTLCPVTARRYP